MIAAVSRLIASSNQLEILSYQHWRHGRTTGLELRIRLWPDDLHQALPIALTEFKMQQRAVYAAGVFLLGEQFTEPAWTYQRDIITALIKSELIVRHNFDSVATYSRGKVRIHAIQVANPLITQLFLSNEVEQIERATFKNIEQITGVLSGLDELIG